MPKVYKNGVVRNVSPKDAQKLKSQKNYVDYDSKAVKKELQGAKKKKAAQTAAE